MLLMAISYNTCNVTCEHGKVFNQMKGFCCSFKFFVFLYYYFSLPVVYGYSVICYYRSSLLEPLQALPCQLQFQNGQISASFEHCFLITHVYTRRKISATFKGFRSSQTQVLPKPTGGLQFRLQLA